VDKMKKNDKLHLPISTEDKNILRSRAEQSGITLSAYCLHILLNTIPETKYLESK